MKKSFFGKKILVKIFTLFVILNFNIFAETYTWNGSVSSDWKDAGNWDTTDSTTPGYNIVLAPATYPVKFSTRTRNDFDSLVVEAGVLIDIDRDITVTNTFTNKGTVTVSGSGIIITCGSISIENTGNFDFASNSVNCGDLQNSGTLTFTGNLDVTNNATFTRDFTNNGTINVSKNATFSDMFTNKGNLSVIGDGNFSYEVNNSGTISISNNANFDTSLINSGTITCGAGDFTVTEYYSGTGTLTLSSGKATFGANVTNNGEIVGGTGELLVNGNYSGSGKLTLSSATSTFKGGTVDFSGTELIHNGGTIIFAKEPSGMYSNYGQVDLRVNDTVFNNVQIGTNDKTVKITVDGNFTVAGDFSASNPKNIISQQQPSSYKGITFSGTGKNISFLGKNTIEQIQVTGGSNTISFASENTITNLSVTANSNEITFSAKNAITDLSVTANSNELMFSANNTIGTLKLNGESIIAKFGAGKTQTITKLTATGTSGNEVLLTTDSASPSVDDNSTWWNVAGLTSGNVTISNAKIEYSKSQNPLLITSLDVTENPEASTENWFLRKFYWFGKTDKNWNTASNWSSSGDSYVACPIAPSIDSVLSEITIVNNDTNILLLDSNINVKTFDVASSATVDFASYNVTSANGISNEGTIRLQGTSGQTFSAHTNKDGSTIEYYGNNFATFAWGTEYRNLKIAESIGGNYSGHILNVQENLIIANNTLIMLKGTFVRNVILGENGINAGSVTLTSSEQMNVSGNCSNLSIYGNLVVNNALSSGGVISVSGTTSATGAILADGDITFGGTADVAGVTSTSGVISFTGDAKASGTISASGNITFGGTADVAGVTSTGGAISFTGDATASGAISASVDITFDGNADVAGVTSINGVISFTGDATASGAISAGGNITFGGTADVAGVTSTSGVISFDGDAKASGAISADGDITFGGTADVAGVTSQSGVISFDGDAKASGTISASEDITFGANAIINEVTSTNGAISVGGTTSANGNITSAQSQTFNGAFTLQSDVVLSAGTNTITFKGTVNGTHALTIGNNANTTNVTFEKSVGSVNKLASLDVKGTITANEAISTTGNIAVGGVANVTEVTSSGGAISVTGDATASGAISARGNITFDGNADVAGVTSSSGVISFSGDAKASGAISAGGDITFGANAIINEVTSSNGAISVEGTTSANGSITSAKSQTFNGAFTLNKTVTILAKNNTVLFKDTVNGTYDLAIGNNANATNVTFEKSVGSTDVINSLFVKGNITAKDKITTKGNISVGGTSSITSATSQSGAISLSGNATASGTISASGNITFGKNANIYEVTSQNGAISVSGTTLANGNITSAQSQTFNGAFTLQNDITFVASKVEFKGKVDSKAGSNYSATFGNETIKTSAAFHFSVGSSVPLGNITLNDASFSENASLIQTESSSLNVKGGVKFGKAQLQLGKLIISENGNFTQTGVNTDSQSVCLIENNGRAIWDSTSLGGSVTLKGDVTGSNAPQVVFNKKNVIIGKDLNIAGVFYNLEIAPNINVTNASGLCVRNNFTINGIYTHNDKKLTLGAITVAGKEYSSGDEGKITGNANVTFGTVEIVQQGTPKNIAISGNIFELIMNNANSTGKISVSSNANTDSALSITTIQNADGTKFDFDFAKNITFENAPTINTTGTVSFANEGITSSQKFIFQSGIAIPKANKIFAKGNFENTAGTVDFAKPVELTGNTTISANDINFSDLNLKTYNIDLTTQNLCFNKSVVSDNNATNSFTLSNLGSAEIKDGVQISCGKINFTGNGTSSVNAANFQLNSLDGNISINDERFSSSAKITVNNEGIFIIDEKSKIQCNNLVQNGNGKNQLAGQFVILENANFNTDVFVTDEFAISAKNMIVGNASSKDLFINAIKSGITKNVEFACDIQSQNFVLLNGNVTLSGNLTTSKDIVLQNGIASQIYKDSESATENLLSYFNSARDGKTALCSLQEFPAQNPDGTNISLTEFASSFGGFGGKTITAGQNFYSNGVDLVPNAKWNLSLKKNDVATSAFGEFHNGRLKNCEVICASGTAYLSCAENSVDEGANSGAYFGRPNFSATGTYTVFDNVIRVEFVDSVLGLKTTIENSNNEISKAIASGYFVHMGNSGKVSFEGTYVDSECNVSTDGKGDLDIFYIKTEEKWNSDATGNSMGNAESTDWSGVHRTAIPYIDLPKALNSLYETLRDNHKNRIAHYYSENAFAGVKDKCSPVLIGIRTGQELHKNNTGTASSQMPYDSHNFIEFQYSESVNTSSILLSDKDDLSKTMNVQATSDFGEIISSGEGLNIAGIAKIQNGKLKTGSTDSSVSSTKIHSLYRNFAVNATAAEKFQSHRMRLGIASFVDKTVLANGKEFHHWVGYIDEGSTPSGTVIPLDSKIVDDKNLIYDAHGNSLDVKGTENHSLLDLSVTEVDSELYGTWDIYAPVFAEYNSSLHESSDKYAEAIGTSSAGYSTLDKIEFHLHDNNPLAFDESAIWFNKVGWCSDSKGKVLYKNFTDATDIFGGARAFDDNATRRTSGGIRYSSLYDKADFFKYTTDVASSEINTSFDATEIKGGAKSLVFIPPVGNRKSTGAEDGLYFSVYLKDKTLPLKSTFVIRYDENACVTDLAGNRLRNKTLSTIDRVSPKFNISVAEVKNNKLYVVFNKKLNVGTISVYKETVDSDIDVKSYSALQKITETLRIVDKTWTPSSEIQIDTNVPAEYVYSNDYFTGLIFTLTKDVKYSDVKNLYLQCYAPETSMDPLSGIPGANVTYVQDNIGNYMAHKEAHALSDFAVGVVNPIFAYDNRQLSDEDYFSKGIYGKILGADESYSVHDWNDEQNNYGTLVTGQDIFINANLSDGTNDNSEMPAKVVGYFDIYKNNNFVSIESDSLSCEYNESIEKADFALSPWRIWLPETVSNGTENPVFKALANKNNKFDLFATGIKDVESAENGENIKINFLLPYDNESENIVHASSSMKACGWDKGQQISFLFGLENEDGTPVQICHSPEYHEATDSYTCDMAPLFALRLKNPADLTSLDLWSFKLQTVALQRGGISVLNNVINVSNDEKAIVQVDMSNSGNLNIAVMTLDGNIVQYLHKGSLEKGTHYFSWNGRTKGNKTVARGLYFVRVFGSGIDETRKIMVVKD